MKAFVFIASLLTFVYCRAQQVQAVPYYIRSNIYQGNVVDALTVFTNQAALAKISNTSVGIYGEKRLLLQELGFYSAGFVVPTTSGSFGVQAVYFGNSNYNESKLGLAYSRKLSERLSIGAQFNYFNYSVAGYGKNNAVTFEAGLLFSVTEQLTAGIHFNNPTRSSFLKNAEEKLPAIYAAGIGYNVSEKFFAGAEIIKTEDRPIDVLASIQYNFEKKVFAKIGMATATSTYYFGSGIVLKDFTLHALANVHPQLGITPALMLTYKKQK